MEIIFFKTMILSIILSTLVFQIVIGGDSVQIKLSDVQTATSSTLKWVAANGIVIPDDVVRGSLEYVPIDISENEIVSKSQIKELRIYICRASLNGKWLPGALLEGTNNCVVSQFNKVYEQRKYDVLQNVDQAARLVWKDWDKTSDVPKGAVAVDEYFIAHSPSKKFKLKEGNITLGRNFLIGKIDSSEGIFGRMSVINEDKEVITDVENGQVLTEIEPVLYELTVEKLIIERTQVLYKNESFKLGEAVLSNNEVEKMKADTIIAYNWKYSSNWGQVKAMLTGLATTIYYAAGNTSVENITWGIDYEKDIDGINKIEAYLEPGTAVHVELLAEYKKVEVPYRGILFSVFKDNKTMNRSINGRRQYTAVTNIRPKFGPVFFIHNNSIVPITPTITPEPESPTTTPTTSSVTNSVDNEITQAITNETLKPSDNTIPEGEQHIITNDSDAMLLGDIKESQNDSNKGEIINSKYTLCIFISGIFLSLIYS